MKEHYNDSKIKHMYNTKIQSEHKYEYQKYEYNYICKYKYELLQI